MPEPCQNPTKRWPRSLRPKVLPLWQESIPESATLAVASGRIRPFWPKIGWWCASPVPAPAVRGSDGRVVSVPVRHAYRPRNRTTGRARTRAPGHRERRGAGPARRDERGMAELFAPEEHGGARLLREESTLDMTKGPRVKAGARPDYEIPAERLPEGFVETVGTVPAEPAVPRPDGRSPRRCAAHIPAIVRSG